MIEFDDRAHAMRPASAYRDARKLIEKRLATHDLRDPDLLLAAPVIRDGLLIAEAIAARHEEAAA